MPFIAPIALTAGTLASAGAAAYGVFSSIEQGNFAEDMAKRNATLARQQGRVAEADFRRQARRRLGAARAAYGASGVDMTGSPLDVLGDEAAFAEQQALLIRYGMRGAVQGERLAGRVAGVQARNNAIGTGLSGAGTLLTQYSQINATRASLDQQGLLS